MSRAVVENYQQMKLNTAEPAELLIMTYEFALKAMRLAERALRKGDTNKAGTEMLRAVAAVNALDEALDVDAAPAGPGLRQVYRYVIQRLLQAASKGEMQPLHECMEHMASLLEAWKQAASGAKA
ncbi:MAG: flagellar export chaperone FliS [Proteobacteria bacterium]|nr:flagellar export chaperone FliS [Pseudomonadota bacterium]